MVYKYPTPQLKESCRRSLRLSLCKFQTLSEKQKLKEIDYYEKVVREEKYRLRNKYQKRKNFFYHDVEVFLKTIKIYKL